jgi:hypothetical protein
MNQAAASAAKCVYHTQVRVNRKKNEGRSNVDQLFVVNGEIEQSIFRLRSSGVITDYFLLPVTYHKLG